jgi:uncharacterized membrane protein HdeD (DUF308 family)
MPSRRVWQRRETRWVRRRGYFLASVIIFGLPGTLAWTLGLLIGINMIFGGCALFATGVHARTEWAVANEIPLRDA